MTWSGRTLVASILGAALLGAAVPPAALGEDEGELGELGELGAEAGQYPLEPPDTSSPRATLRSFFEDAREAWTIFLGSDEPRRERYARAGRHLRRAARCLDLSELAPAERVQLGMERAVLLLDVLERIPISPWREIPDLAQVEAQGLTEWTIPHTRIRLRRVAEGPRAGEFLFTPRTVERLPEFYERTRHLEPRAKAVVADGYPLFRTIPGWMIPMRWVQGLPAWLRADVAGQTVWQWTALALVLALATGALLLVRHWTHPPWSGGAMRDYARRMAVPLLVVVLGYPVREIAMPQIGLSGTILTVFQLSVRVVMMLASAWLAVLLGGFLAEAVVRSPRIQPQSVDSQLLHVGARLLGLVAAVLILVQGARVLGIPVVGVIAGLGVGGLAVALAAQSTLENFIGSITIFADRPVRVGDFCRFGDQVGTVEQIGLRSTQIRTLGRSLVTVPNAEFSRLQLDNYTQRDNNLFHTKVYLRYEATPAQLRAALEGIRSVLREHPRVLEEPARVRLAEFAPHAFELEIFAYVDEADWNAYLAIREDLFLKIADAVEAAGTRLAVPAQTTHLAPDSLAGPRG